MQEQFLNHIKSNLPFLQQSKLIITISGGLDSVVLTHLCNALNLNFGLAHCNFNLRENESDADEAFVFDLAKTLDLEVFVQHFDTKMYAKANKLSIQMAARQLRYNWFQDIAEQLKFDYILTAHHADDNLETFLINLTRGTGLEGLSGIPEINDNVVRPLLIFSREEIKHYAKANNLKWREDSSNASTKYLRNKLRHDVIPTLKEVNPELLANFKNTLSNLNDTTDIIEESVNAVLKRAIKTIDDTNITYYVSAFIKLNNPKAYLFQVFKDFGFTQWDDIVNLLTAQSGKQVFSSSHNLLKDRECLILSQIDLEDTNFEITINSEDQNIKTPLGDLSFIASSKVHKTDKSTIYVDAKTLNFPLTVRHWQDGDYFYPLGMQGKKKLSKFFKDEKLSLIAKQKVLLLCNENEIVWVINHRANTRFKVTDTTKSILKIKLSK